MLLLIVYLGLFILAMAFPRSKYLTIAIALFMLFIFSFAWHEGDLEVYEWVYRDLYTGRFNTHYEPGFVTVMWVCKKMGMSFTGFRLVLGIYNTAIAYRFVRKQTNYHAIAMALYALFPFFMFASVLRSGVASAFVLLAVEQLIKGNSDKKKYVFFIILAILFHYSSVLFLPFILFTGKIKKNWLAEAFAGMCVLAFFVNYTDVIYSVVSRYTQREKIIGWLMKSEASANLNGIMAIIIILTALFYLNYRSIHGAPALNLEGYCDSGLRDNQIKISYQMSVYMMFLSPLMVLASPILRIPYMVFLLFIVSAVNIAYRNRGNHLYRCHSTMMINFSWVALLLTVLLWKFYADLPYLKNGAHVFGEYLDSQFR